MKKNFYFYIATALMIVGMIFTVSCGKRVDPFDTTSEVPGEAGATMDAGDEMERTAFIARDIHFEYDSYVLTDEAKEMLKGKYQWLEKNPRAVIVIQGHCDERGTNAYNLVLGEKRAKSAQNYLIDLGASPVTLSTVSFGEEQPMDPDSNEGAWAKNRRAHFVIAN